MLEIFHPSPTQFSIILDVWHILTHNFQPSFPWEQLLKALPLKKYPVHKEGKCPEEDKKKHLIVLNWSTNLPPTLVELYLFPLIFYKILILIN